MTGSAQKSYMTSTSSEPAPETAQAPKRAKFIGFVRDEETAAILSAALEPSFPHGSPFHVVPFRGGLSILSRMVTPEVVLIDISGEDQPLNAMADLAEAVEQGTTVLLIGEARDLTFYRATVSGMGVKEYLSKPLTKAAVTQHFLPHITGSAALEGMRRGGRLIAVTGVRGGVGTTTLATNLAWSIGHDKHRHVLLLDTDLQTGTTALALGITPSHGLATAIEAPERIDPMLLERVSQPAGDRLHLLAAQQSLLGQLDYAPGAAGVLTKVLGSRYNFVVVDAGARHMPFAREMLHLAHQRVIVLDPTILAIRNLERLSQLPAAPHQNPKPILVLNQANRPFGMSQAFMEEKLGVKFDVVIPDLPRTITKADQYGDMAAAIRGPFRNATLRLGKLLGADMATEEANRISVAA